MWFGGGVADAGAGRRSLSRSIRAADVAGMRAARSARGPGVGLGAFAALAVLLLVVVGAGLGGPVAQAGQAQAAQAGQAQAGQAGQAQAAPRHTSLRSISPADGAVLATPPTQIVLVFDEAVSERFHQVVLTRAGAAVSLGETAVSSDTVRTPIPGMLEAGAYRIAYRVVATDGHPITGQSAFEVAGVGSPSGSAGTAGSVTAAPTGDATPAAAGSPEPPNHLPGYAISGALLLGAVGLLIWDRRRRRAATDFPPEPGSV